MSLVNLENLGSLSSSEKGLIQALNACSSYRESKRDYNYRFERDVKDRLCLSDVFLRLLHKEDLGILLTFSPSKDDVAYVIQVDEDLGLSFFVMDLSQCFSECMDSVDYSYFHVTGLEERFLCACDLRDVCGDFEFDLGRRECDLSLLDLYDGKAFEWKV